VSLLLGGRGRGRGKIEVWATGGRLTGKIEVWETGKESVEDNG